MRTLARTLLPGLATAALASAVFAWLAHAVMQGTLAGFDLDVRSAIHSRATPAMTRAMQSITQLGSSPVLVVFGLIACLALARRGRVRAAVILAVSALGAEAFDQTLKALFHRPRPEAFFGLSPVSYSFPSGHSVESCCFYGVLAAIAATNTRSRRERIGIWILASLTALAVGTSRIYLGVHYPTDVLGGYVAAVAWVSLVWTIYQVWRRQRGGAMPTAGTDSAK